MKKVKKMALGGMGAKTQSQMQNAAQGAFKSAGMNVPNLPKMTGPLGSVGKPPATPPAGLNVAGIKQATAGLGDTFKGAARPPTSLANLGSALQQLGKGNPNIQKTDTSTGGPPLQRFSNPEQYKQAAAAYNQTQQQQQLANSVGRLPSVTPASGQNSRFDRPIGGAEAKALGLGMKKGGSVSSASKRADGCAQRGKTKGKIV